MGHIDDVKPVFHFIMRHKITRYPFMVLMIVPFITVHAWYALREQWKECLEDWLDAWNTDTGGE